MGASFRRRFFRHRFLGQEKKLHLWYFRTIRKLTSQKLLVESFSLQCVRNERRKDGYLKARNKSVNLVSIAEIVCKKTQQIKVRKGENRTIHFQYI